MFGHQDDKHRDEGNEDEHHEAAVQQVGPDHPDDHEPHDQSAQDNGGGVADDNAAQAQNDASAGAWQHPGEPTDSDNGGDNGVDNGLDSKEPIRDIVAPSGGHKSGPVPPMPMPPPHHGTDDDDDAANVPHELIDIKRKALTQLKPLAGQLDLSPEDKFRTTMMMIQAGDDQNLIKEAYAAIDEIKDEKARAQALLDIVNEINYFTQHPTT